MHLSPSFFLLPSFFPPSLIHSLTPFLPPLSPFLSSLLPVAMKPHEVQESLHMSKLRDRQWYVQPSCATSGDGLYEGLTWLTSNHKNKK